MVKQVLAAFLLDLYLTNFRAMPRRACCRARSSPSCADPFLITVATMISGLVIWIAVLHTQHIIATQKKLRSLLAYHTPFSGFYGPGSWWAWLITLGMTHAHMGINLLATGELPDEWDFDLIAASGSTIAAAIDLISKNAQSQSALDSHSLPSPLPAPAGSLCACEGLQSPVSRCFSPSSRRGLPALHTGQSSQLTLISGAIYASDGGALEPEDIPFSLVTALDILIAEITMVPILYTSKG
ncbi:hypothetical protein C8R45DRAFT_1098929 [Mycena sanguinolenta]|nr:hypothetical protein C8R45DRAFT_1098929 [Mycena sanguinolenta]